MIVNYNNSNIYNNPYNLNFQARTIKKKIDTVDRFKGCLLGGAMGDALGRPIEFEDISSIKQIYGKRGLSKLQTAANGKALVTDDTQMTIFTIDGLIKALRKSRDIKIFPDFKTIFDSYKLWYNTQQCIKLENKGWVSSIKALYVRRDPGITCEFILKQGNSGSLEKPINKSTSCGGVMRVAPVGLLYKDNPEMAFETGARCAALTHGDPRGYLSAGFLSGLIAHITNGKSINSAVNETLKTLKSYPKNEPIAKLIKQAQKLSKSKISPTEAIEKLGEGWDGDEAIAIATYCALKEPNNFIKAAKMAVNHSGDSDSTGAILGNILGAYLGENGLPKTWIKKVELMKEIKKLANDLNKPIEQLDNMSKEYPIP